MIRDLNGEMTVILPWWMTLRLGGTGIAIMSILALLVYQIWLNRHVLLFYDVIFAERVRQFDQQSQELHGLEAQVEAQAHQIEGLEQHLREVEGRMGQRDTPEAPP